MNRYRCNEIVIMDQVCVSSVGGKSVNPVVFVFVFVIVFVFVLYLYLYFHYQPANRCLQMIKTAKVK